MIFPLGNYGIVNVSNVSSWSPSTALSSLIEAKKRSVVGECHFVKFLQLIFYLATFIYNSSPQIYDN